MGLVKNVAYPQGGLYPKYKLRRFMYYIGSYGTVLDPLGLGRFPVCHTPFGNEKTLKQTGEIDAMIFTVLTIAMFDSKFK